MPWSHLYVGAPRREEILANARYRSAKYFRFVYRADEVNFHLLCAQATDPDVFAPGRAVSQAGTSGLYDHESMLGLFELGCGYQAVLLQGFHFLTWDGLLRMIDACGLDDGCMIVWIMVGNAKTAGFSRNGWISLDHALMGDDPFVARPPVSVRAIKDFVPPPEIADEVKKLLGCDEIEAAYQAALLAAQKVQTTLTTRMRRRLDRANDSERRQLLDDLDGRRRALDDEAEELLDFAAAIEGSRSANSAS